MDDLSTIRLEYIGEQQGATTWSCPSGREYRAGDNDTDRFIEVPAEDAEHLLQFAVFRLAPPPPPMPTVLALPSEVVFFLNTGSEFLANWLSTYTRSISMHSFPTERGRIVLQSMRGGRRLSGRQVMEMPADYLVPYDGGSSEMLHGMGPAIEFEVVALAAERIEVKATCHQPVVFAYFRILLREIAKRWPEAEGAIIAFVADQLLTELDELDPNPPTHPNAGTLNLSVGEAWQIVLSVTTAPPHRARFTPSFTEDSNRRTVYLHDGETISRFYVWGPDNDPLSYGCDEQSRAASACIRLICSEFQTRSDLRTQAGLPRPQPAHTSPAAPVLEAQNAENPVRWRGFAGRRTRVIDAGLEDVAGWFRYYLMNGTRHLIDISQVREERLGESMIIWEINQTETERFEGHRITAQRTELAAVVVPQDGWAGLFQAVDIEEALEGILQDFCGWLPTHLARPVNVVLGSPPPLPPRNIIGDDIEPQNEPIRTNRTPYGIREDTKTKLDRLRIIRDQSINKGKVTKSWTTACEEASINERTARTWAPDLRRYWDDPQYSPRYTWDDP